MELQSLVRMMTWTRFNLEFARLFGKVWTVSLVDSVACRSSAAIMAWAKVCIELAGMGR
jgi:hypothetical protein